MHWLRKDRGPQTCIGVWDRKVEFVYAFEHEEHWLGSKSRLAGGCSGGAHPPTRVTNPHKDGWESTYRAMQEQARSTLAAIGECDLSASMVVDAAALAASRAFEPAPASRTTLGNTDRHRTNMESRGGRQMLKIEDLTAAERRFRRVRALELGLSTVLPARQ
ncbi:MAG: hypothetical protein IPN24_18310 [Betaproteobacteria bacterium]|nr:hypothetical protein [Betaproteobacteria bacterium]